MQYNCTLNDFKRLKKNVINIPRGNLLFFNDSSINLLININQPLSVPLAFTTNVSHIRTFSTCQETGKDVKWKCWCTASGPLSIAGCGLSLGLIDERSKCK